MVNSNSVSWRLARRWGRIAMLAGMALLVAHLTLSSAEAQSRLNRQSCSEIAGTRYNSTSEREWYWAYCLKQPLPTAHAQTTSNSMAQQFTDGYRKAGGPEQLLNHILYRVIPCESTYNPYALNHVGPFYGLMQFYPPTWYAMGGGDWFSAWWQGYNTAKLLHHASPGTQWPHCWFA